MKSVFWGIILGSVIAYLLWSWGSDGLISWYEQLGHQHDMPTTQAVSAKSRLKWLLMLPAFWLHHRSCSKAIANNIAAKQEEYFKDINTRHITLGYLINLKLYTSYRVHLQSDLAIPTWHYWRGLLFVALWALLLYLLPV